MLPAFPTLPEHGFNQGMPGMTLRDFFAAMAITGKQPETNKGVCQYMAKGAYMLADEMMKAREA